MKLLWDKGILWLHINGQAIPFNSYEALELLEKLKDQEEIIKAQEIIDRAEGL